MTEPICTIRDMKKSFILEGKEIHVLQGVNLTIHAGDMCAVQGKSGVGKSTLLHIMGGLDRPTSGSVQYFGKDVFNLPEPELARFRNRSIGFVFQFHHLLPEFTAAENVALPAMIAREHQRDAMERAHDLLDRVGLAHRAGHRPGELSGGEQQRVAIARALTMQPKLVLADEPTGNLDQATSNAIHELLLSLNESHGVAFLVVTHNGNLAAMMRRQLEMRGGLVYEGGP